MRLRLHAVTMVVALLPRLAAAQQTTTPAAQPAAMSAAPVAQAFRENAHEMGVNLVAAAVEMPAAKYAFKPTPAQMSFGSIVVHLAQGNDYLCGAIAGTKAPERSKIAATAKKDSLVARLRETFAFCDQALAAVDDSKLAEQMPFFGQTKSRAAVMTLTTGDWADHYSQAAIYLRLNGMLPPTAKKPATE